MIYLDYQATTPLAPEAFEAMVPWLRDHYANPHSPSRIGRAAKAAVEVARAQVAALLPSGGRVVFTSGATEALNWAVKGSAGAVVTIASEHAAVLDTVKSEGSAGREVTVLPVRPDGRIDLWVARRVLRQGAGLFAAMAVNNEIGVLQPLAELTRMARQRGILVLCDAVQGYGRIAIPPECDLIAISAHKIHGPKGIGALWIRDGVALDPLLHGGDQEGGRSGTLSPALCVGFGIAARLMAERHDADAAHVERLWQMASERLVGWTINGSSEHRYHGNVNVRRERLDVNRLMSDCRDIAFSAGSACASGSGRPSHVLKAIGLSDAEARASIRLGFGRYTTEAELGEALTTLIAAADSQRIAA
ncbi:cysteine desulfurase family protein [Sphingomonas radiodurans]|uniref:cysteine desulfurase family protein n=1 Tax=Sphingomonas radiodurans TaxID=2890321 RepID=UPI001E652CA1|nr:cysteine desulfurase family protein [Sphingomonas radiodurans]WBH16651.1 cysteine desulfurase family protein [Sphingomonas radiodurans]